MSKLAKILATGVLMATMIATLGSAPAFADNWHGGGYHGHNGYRGDNGWHGGRGYGRGWRGPSRVVYVPPPPPRVIYRSYPVYYDPYYAPPPPVVYRSSSFGFWFD